MKSGTSNVQLLEHKWFNIFIILPFVDIDAHGTVREETRRLKVTSRWSIVEDLLRPILQAQAERRNARYATLNDYTSSVFARCFVLITKWGWIECESVIRVVYDFFARRNPQNLQFETFGPPPPPGF
jgi:Mus7/MMS22 family